MGSLLIFQDKSIFVQNHKNMTTVFNVNLNELSSQFIQDLKQKFGKTKAVELRLHDKTPADGLLSETDFWGIIDSIDWTKKKADDKLASAIKLLSDKPLSNIYIFADKLSEKLYFLDTKQHAQARCLSIMRRK